jgi:hypothetical protein
MRPILIPLPRKAAAGGEQVIEAVEGGAVEAVAEAATVEADPMAAEEDVVAGGRLLTALPKRRGMLPTGMEGMPEAVAVPEPTAVTRMIRTVRHETMERRMGDPEVASHQLRDGTAEEDGEPAGDGTSAPSTSHRHRRRPTPRTTGTRRRPMTLNPTGAPGRRATRVAKEVPRQFKQRFNRSEINRERTRRKQGKVQAHRSRLRMVLTVT